MGVPKFYRYISERYPCLSEVIDDTQIPEFDNLYLDMNGIIHNCSHPNDDDATFRITEEQIFHDIFSYIDALFRKIRPRKVFFMAVDGVAPRAKMNQQRARRFMSARTAEESLRKAVARGEEIPDTDRFDSNCITPGTPFMTKLHTALTNWALKKAETDLVWKGVRVIVSGHDVPGEGEHKIMDFIRSERASENYDPNTRHCMYGLDADLIMLGLCSHEPHFSLLREEVKFNSRPPPKGKNKRKEKEAPKKSDPTHITFHLLHLSLMREYLGLEFQELKNKISFEFDLERIIDDWVLMGFLIGNDFIPHLPHVHIHDEALPLLYETYMKVLPTLDGYINMSGELNLKRFEIFLKAVAENDRQKFLEIADDQVYFAAKRGKGAEMMIEEEFEVNKFEALEKFDDSDMSSSETEQEPEESSQTSSGEAAFVSSDEDDNEPTNRSDLESNSVLKKMGLIDDPIEDEFNDALAMAEMAEMDETAFQNNVEACWSRAIGNSFKRHKKDYYKEKLKFANISKDQLRGQCEGYVRAIQWVLHYYYHGCVSWNWYFEHHYAPFISDIIDFTGMEMNFELSKPFHPFEQLLAVLPAASSSCLPVPLRELMCSKESPIADFYPIDFETDLNGKKNDWEAVVLIPFIDEKRLLDAMKSKENLLSDDEKARNSFGSHVEIVSEKDLTKKSATKTLLNMDLFRIPREKVVWGLLSGVQLDVYFPGFPTMKHLDFTANLQKASVTVFQQQSKMFSIVLKIHESEEMKRDISEVAADLIGKEVCMDWPVLKIGLVDSIYSTDTKYITNRYGVASMVPLDDEEKVATQKMMTYLKDRQKSRYAIDVYHASAIAYIRRFNGVTHEYDSATEKLVAKKQFSPSEAAVPVLLPLVVSDVNWFSGKMLNDISAKDAYPIGTTTFVLQTGWKGFGYPMKVEGYMANKDNQLRVIVYGNIWKQPDLHQLKATPHSFSLTWMQARVGCKSCNMNARTFARLTGYIPMFLDERSIADRGAGIHGKMNIGLNLKSPKAQKEMHNYVQNDETDYFIYSNLCVRLVSDYRKTFPEITRYLMENDKQDGIYAHEIWPNEEKRQERLAALKEYLHGQATYGVPLEDFDVSYADCVLIGHIEHKIKDMNFSLTPVRCNVSPQVLFRAELGEGKTWPDPDADFEVLDRVTFLGQQPAPFGAQGTVIGVFKDKVEVLFDREFEGGYRKGNLASCSRVPYAQLLNFTFGLERKQAQGKSAPKKKESTPVLVNPKRNNDRPTEKTRRKPEVRDVGPSEAWIPKSKRKEEIVVEKSTIQLLKRTEKAPETSKASEEDERLRIASNLCSALGILTPTPSTAALTSETNAEVTRVAQLFSQVKISDDGTKETTKVELIKKAVNEKKKEKSKRAGQETSSLAEKTKDPSESCFELEPERGSAESTKTENLSEKESKKSRNSEGSKNFQQREFVNSNLRMMPDTSKPPPLMPSRRRPGTGWLSDRTVPVRPFNPHPHMHISPITREPENTPVVELMPTSNINKQNLTDLKPSTIGRGRPGRGRGRGGAHHHAPKASNQMHRSSSNSSMNKMPIQQPQQQMNQSGKKKRSSRVAAQFQEQNN